MEWKFARSKLWISYFEEGGTCPPPFNIIPTPKSLFYIFQWVKRKFCGHSKAVKKEHMKTIRVSAVSARGTTFPARWFVYGIVSHLKNDKNGTTKPNIGN